MGADQPVFCGDCKSTLHPESTTPETAVASDAETYCPGCRSSVVKAATCHRCGSEVCGTCGSIIECATDLGFG